MLIVLIIAAEIAFWLILVSGLTARYVLGRPRLGIALLVATPWSISPCSSRRRLTCAVAATPPYPTRSQPSTSASRWHGGSGSSAGRTFASRTGSPTVRRLRNLRARVAPRSPPAPRVASPPECLGNRHGSPGHRDPARWRPRPHRRAPQRRRALEPGPCHRLPHLVQLHGSAAIAGRKIAGATPLNTGARTR